MANPFVHVELNTTDVGKAKAFYGKLFDWKLEDVPMGPMTYTMIGVGEGTGGGIVQHPVAGAPSAWLAYVIVDDVAAATAMQSRQDRIRGRNRNRARSARLRRLPASGRYSRNIAHCA